MEFFGDVAVAHASFFRWRMMSTASRLVRMRVREFVTCDGAEWIRTVLAGRGGSATVCLDTFHLVTWATDARVLLESLVEAQFRAHALCGGRRRHTLSGTLCCPQTPWQRPKGAEKEEWWTGQETTSGTARPSQILHVVEALADYKRTLDQVRRDEWNELRRRAGAGAKALEGMRWLLLRNWANLSSAEKGVLRGLERANRRLFRAWQLKEELRELLRLPLIAASRVLDEWLLLRQPLAPRALRPPRPQRPSLPGVGRGDDRVEAHERHCRGEQRRDRPYPLRRSRLSQPRALRHDDHARPRRHRPGAALGRLSRPRPPPAVRENDGPELPWAA